ncbi:MAG: fibronectin type III domain-containing protein [Patescibacteria group bacterium]
MKYQSIQLKVFLFAGMLLIMFVFGTESAEAANWYIRKGSNGNGSSWTNAWDDINNISGIAAGDTVYIAAGTYTGNYTFTVSGSAGNPITIKRAVIAEHGSATGWSDGYDGIVTIDGAGGETIFNVNNKNNLVFDGTDKTKFILDGNSVASYGIFGNGTSTHSIVIRYITFHHFYATGVIFGKESGFSNNVEIANSEFYKNGNSVNHDNDGGIILLYATTLGYGRNKVHDNYLHDSCITAEREACDLMTGQIKYTDIYNNHFASGWTGINSADMLTINDDYNNIYNNFFEGTFDGNNQMLFIHTNNPAAKTPDHNNIYNNVFYSPLKTSASSNCGITGQLAFSTYGTLISYTNVYNNIFYGYYKSITFTSVGGGPYSNIDIRNNIFWPSNANPCGYKQAVDWGTIKMGPYSSTILNYNYYRYSDRIWETNRNFAQVQADGKELQGGYGDPLFDSITPTFDSLFVNWVAGLRLTSSSPSPVLNGGLTDPGTGIFSDDYFGTSRPQGAAWDIGAYEYLVSGPPPLDTTSPSIPTNLSATPISSSQINLSWIASTDNVGVLGYRIFRDSSQLSTVTGQLSYSDTNLSPSTSYTYTVSAYDAAGNNSNQSTSAQATTFLISSSSSYEAESCILASPMQIVSDSLASNNQYIQTSILESGTATCSFSVSAAGAYKIIARVFAQNGGTDSFYFQIDNSPEDIWDLNPTASPGEYSVWREDDLAKRGTGTFDNPQYDPYTLTLSSGAHTLALRGRESNTRLDYFYLTRLTDTAPPSAPQNLSVN